jgi:RNA polymerase sigma factor (sigma-70 family)
LKKDFYIHETLLLFALSYITNEVVEQKILIRKNTMRTDDGYIIYKCLNGEPESFGVLVDKYKEGIYAYTFTKLQDWQDAQDVTQETFIQAYRKLHTLKRWDSFAGWLYRIASNFCKNWKSSKSKRPDSDFIDDQNPAMIDKPSIDYYHENEMVESVHEALNSLSETYREVLTLYYFGGMDSNKIAEVLNTSPVAIRIRLSRARAQLREEIFNMMSITFEQQKLRSGFTFRIVEAIKRIKIHPTSQTKGIPWGVSLAFGMIMAVIGLNPHLFTFNLFNSYNDLTVPAESRVLEFGEIPVKMLKISNAPIISDQQGNGNSLEPGNAIQNALFMAPNGEPDTWEKIGDIPTERGGFSSSVVDGKIYIMGGGTDREHVLSTVEEYDPATGIWTKKADMLTPRGFLSTSVVNGKIYAIGGARMQGVPLSVVEEYDPVKDTWTKKADMPTARFNFSASVVNGKIYAIGGSQGYDAVNKVWLYLSTVEEYDPIKNKWTKKANMLLSKEFLSTCTVNGKIYTIGGASFDLGPFRSLTIVEEYDPLADRWVEKSDMPTARSGLSTCVINGKIFAIGGGDQANNVPTSAVEVYDPINDTWEKKPDMPTARVCLKTNAVNGMIYTIGGSPGFMYTFGGVPPILTTIEVYNTGFTSSSVDPKGKLPTTWGEKKK